jgi:Alginate export
VDLVLDLARTVTFESAEERSRFRGILVAVISQSILGCGAPMLAVMSAARAQDTGTSGGATKPTRPAISADRWQEDWSVLADPELRSQPFDNLKYIPLSSSDPNSYISLGLNLRERFEYNNAPSFGVGRIPGDSYLLQRLQWHVDVHINENWQVFTRAPGKRIITPVDENPLTINLWVIFWVHVGGGNSFGNE